MRLNQPTGLLDGVRYQSSPHCDERPSGIEIDLVVLHGISLPPSIFEGDAIEQLFLGTLDYDAHPYFDALRDTRVSAHILIRRDGSMTQYVPFIKRAWHAGPSQFGDRTQCNDFSIGIELEGTDTLPYAPAQYQQLARLLPILMRAYPLITWDHVVGHSDIAPGRKTDPGPAFDWSYLRRKASHHA